MKIKALVLVGLLVVPLGACVSPAPGTGVLGTGYVIQSGDVTVVKSIAAAEQGLTLAMSAALVYTSLPRCGAVGATVICSDRDLVREIREAAIKAHNALLDAKANAALIGAAVAAIDTFRAIVPRA